MSGRRFAGMWPDAPAPVVSVAAPALFQVGAREPPESELCGDQSYRSQQD